MKRLWILLFAMLLPAGALAVPVPVVLTAVQGQTDGVKHSNLHDAVRCNPADTLFMCGGNRQSVAGVLTADFEAGVFSNIMGTLDVDGVPQAVTGNLDFNVAGGMIIGTLTIGSAGTFEFFNLALAGVFNSADQVTQTMYLWGQNFGMTPAGQDAPAGALGTDLVFTWDDAPPVAAEPSMVGGVLGLFGLASFARRRSR